MADWLLVAGVTHCAMESTGVYWKPVFNILEGQVEVLLVNAHHIKNVPGRKTDVKDAEWSAQLLAHGLLRPSLIPPPPIRELRDLTRQRTPLVRDRARVANRLQKVLEDANIKLADVASEPLGVSGRAMIRRLIAGDSVIRWALAELARRQLRREDSPTSGGVAGSGHRPSPFPCSADSLDQIAYLEGMTAEFDARIGAAMRPAEQAQKRDCGRSPASAARSRRQSSKVEKGADTENRFPTAGHLASWAGLVSWEPSQRRVQTPQRQDPQKQPMAAHDAGGGGVIDLAHQSHESWDGRSHLGEATG